MLLSCALVFWRWDEVSCIEGGFCFVHALGAESDELASAENCPT
jgi:hypothetical protein